MRNHTDLLNLIAHAIGAKTYLEIGVNIPAHNFNRIDVPLKTGVDPNPGARATYVMTSDEFFAQRLPGLQYDLVFIDGLHHDYQVARDFDNALKVLSPGGFIVLHDTNPALEDHAVVPRAGRGTWCGDVYKFACCLQYYPDIDFVTVDFDNGCTVVWRAPGKTGRPDTRTHALTWAEFAADRSPLRRITPAMFASNFSSK